LLHFYKVAVWGTHGRRSCRWVLPLCPWRLSLRWWDGYWS
jgi:hypothetical protein